MLFRDTKAKNVSSKVYGGEGVSPPEIIFSNFSLRLSPRCHYHTYIHLSSIKTKFCFVNTITKKHIDKHMFV
jgi:hypothetical protein